MPPENPESPISERELVLTRVIRAAPEKLFRAWTEPSLLKQWFAPLPWTVAHVETDLRPGGQCVVVMRSPEGQEFPSRGVYLDVVRNQRLVFTDAFVGAWEPSTKAFMVAMITFERLLGGEGAAVQTRYTARVQHWSPEDRKAHEGMGFHDGWGKCAEQLAALAAKM